MGNYNHISTAVGRAYVHDLLSASPTTPVLTPENPAPQNFENFGSAVALQGTRLCVSEVNDHSGTALSGSVHVYDLAGSPPGIPQTTISPAEPSVEDLFGSSVAVSGRHVVVGAPFDDSRLSRAGAAYVYDLSLPQPAESVLSLHKPDAVTQASFGTVVAISGRRAAIAAPRARSGWDNLENGLLWWLELGGQRADHDSDGDGIENLLEMAFGMNPNRADNQALPRPTLSEGRLTMMITKRPGVRYEVQSAGTLLPGQSQSFSKASTVVLMDDASSLQVRDDPPPLGANMRFMRVHVRPQP